jgi:hypothetical protein
MRCEDRYMQREGNELRRILLLLSSGYKTMVRWRASSE